MNLELVEARKAIRRRAWSLTITLCFLASFFIYQILLTNRSVGQIEGTFGELIRSGAIRLDTVRLESSLKTAETAQRGFLLTRDPIFLTPSAAAEGKVDEYLADLRSLVQTDEAEISGIQAISKSTRLKLAEMDETVQLGKQGHWSRAIEVVELKYGLELMSDIERNVEQLQSYEDSRIAMLKSDRQLRYSYLERVSAISSVFGLILIFLAAIAAYSYFRLVRRFDRLRQMNEARLEREVLTRTKELSDINRDLESFSYSISHDLRAPLRSMDGFARVLELESKGVLNDEAKDALVRIRAASQRMFDLIEDTLKLSRVTRKAIKRQSINFSELCEQIAEEFKSIADYATTEVEIEKGMSVYCDRGLCKMTVQNLLENAFKFSSKSKNPQVQVGAVANSIPRKFFVKDNGTGFQMEYVEKVFEPFQRLHRQEEFSGTGIGLAIVKRAVERAGGAIEVQSEVGKGTTFFFTLEAAAEYEPDLETKSNSLSRKIGV